MEEMDISPGYELSVADAESGAVTYAILAAAVEAHNAAAKPGEAYWGIGLNNSIYRVYAYGAVPEPPTEEELAREEELRRKEAEKQEALDKLPETVKTLKEQNQMLVECLMEMSETVYA